jgi:hypothetical protein
VDSSESLTATFVMNSLEIALTTFLLIFGAACAGFLCQRVLPSHHLSEQSKSAVHLGAGLIGTLSALILGLLVSSTKESYDQAGNLVNEMCAGYAHADRLLANYGPEAAPLRNMLRSSLEHAFSLVWPEECGKEGRPTLNDQTSSKMVLETLSDRLSLLKPSDAVQQRIQNDTLRLLDDMIQKRWLLQEVVYGGGITWILLVIPVLFIAFITFVYALYAPRNPTVVGVLLCTSVCIAVAVFLIGELSTPFQGVLKISSKPVCLVLQRLGAD